MPNVVVGMTMSLDGFVNDSSGSVASLYLDFESFQDSEYLKRNYTKNRRNSYG